MELLQQLMGGQMPPQMHQQFTSFFGTPAGQGLQQQFMPFMQMMQQYGRPPGTPMPGRGSAGETPGVTTAVKTQKTPAPKVTPEMGTHGIGEKPGKTTPPPPPNGFGGGYAGMPDWQNYGGYWPNGKWNF